MTTKTVLHTERLVLRPFEPGDITDVHAYRDDQEFARFLPHIPQPFTKKDAEAFVALNMSEPWDRSPTFALSMHGRVIGTANLEVNRQIRSAMLGYAIGRAWWGQGIATEASRAVIKWGVPVFQLTRLWASTDVRHLRSQRVLEKLGLRREKVLVADHVGRHGELVDEVIFGTGIATACASTETS